VTRPGALSALLLELARVPEASTGGISGPNLAPGATVGRFELVREIGRGSFGVVFEARDTALGRSVAFKVVRPGRADTATDQLRREAEAIASLSHPNLVKLHDAGRSEQGPYLVLELLHGETLQARLKRGRLDTPETLRIATDVARGLSHAHLRGVVHRDLKASNVFLCQDGGVKVLDFGLAHAFGRRGLEGGTPDAMAPEQWRGAPEDERSDVFALGALLYRMLSGERPFPDDGGRAVLSDQPAPRLEVPDAPGLGDVIAALLAKDPVERPRDGAAALAVLEAVRSEPLPSASSSSSQVRIRRPLPRRSRLAVALGAVLLLALAGAGAWRFVVRPGAAEDLPSVAVLPFVDQSPSHDQGYFSDGLSEEILNALARGEWLRVTGRTSSFAFKGKDEDLRSIGRKLGVEAVLEGSVRKDGQRIRVTAQLVKTADGYHLWSQTFDREAAGVFAVQDEIAAAVVSALRVKLMAGRPATAQALRTTDPEAYNQYLLGRQYERLFNPDDYRRASAAYERALAIDPSYAPAWAGLANAVYWGQVNESLSTASMASAQARSLEAAERAVALGPELPEAWAVRGFLRVNFRWDWAGARADLDQALRLNPSQAESHRILSHDILSAQGRLAEARLEGERAVTLDPLLASAWSSLAFVALAEGRLEPARAAALRSLELQPKQDIGPAYLSSIELTAGRPEAALAAARLADDEVFKAQYEAMALHSLGRPAEAARALEALIAAHAHDGAYNIGVVYAWRGERDRAFEWLERAEQNHDGGMLEFLAEPALRPVRGDPRFKALLRRMRLAD